MNSMQKMWDAYMNTLYIHVNICIYCYQYCCINIWWMAYSVHQSIISYAGLYQGLLLIYSWPFHVDCPLAETMTARIDQEVWQSTRSLVDCNRYMLENQCQCDVTFLLVPSNGVESSRISAHKYVLMARSPVFMAMFTGPLAEHDDVIKVTDVSSECFKALLR